MASSAEQETRLCGNCKHDIPTVNFTIHEIHCRRNICICDLCKEPVPRSDMEEHHATEHATVTCKCSMTMEKCALEEHEKYSCPLRLVQCQFCELEVTFNTLENHEDYCGARTEPCEKCCSSVMIKDLKDHPTVCGKVKPQKNPMRVHSWASNKNYELPLHSALSSSTFTDRLNPAVQRNIPKRFYGKSILTPEFGDLNQNPRREQSEADVIQLPCEFCERLFPEDYLIMHQTVCLPSVSCPDRRRSPSPLLDFTENLRSSPPPALHNPSPVMIPCEFCGVLMEGDVLFHHQDQCDMGQNSEKTAPFDNVSADVSAEDVHRSFRAPAASQAPGSDNTMFSRNQIRGNTSVTSRVDNLYRQNNTRRPYDEMRKRNMEENARMMQDASNREAGTRRKPKKKMNTRPDEVDSEE